MANTKVIEEAKIRRDELESLINKHPEGLTTDEVAAAVNKRYTPLDVGRALRNLYKNKRVDRVPSELRIHTYIPSMRGGDTKPIAFNYIKYLRGEVPLINGVIPPQPRKELIELIENNMRIKNSTPKDLSMRVKFMDERNGRVATLIYEPNGNSGVMYKMGELNVMDERGLLNFLGRGVVEE